MKTVRGAFLCALLVSLAGGTGGATQTAPEESLRPESAQFAPPVATPPDRLRIVSFNVHYARDLALLAESFRASATLREADLVLIQEIESYGSEGASRARKLAEALRLNYVYAPARITRAGGTHGLAILSRHPLSDIEVLPLPHNDLGAKTRRRIALGATVEIGGQRLRLYNVHLDTRINIAERRAQLQPVLDVARRQAIEAVLIGGDFNTNPFRWAWSGRLPFLRSNQAAQLDYFMIEQGFATPLAESGSTSRRTLWRVRLDSIYIRGLEARGSDVEREVDVSDHFPVWLDVAWPPAASRATSPRGE